jgi:phosphate butyryltransferase
MAIIPAPDFKQKTAIMNFLIQVSKSLENPKPKVAVLAATEQVSVGMPACAEAAWLGMQSQRGQIPGAIVDGPLSLDCAIDKESAQTKKLTSEVAGDADCLLFPNIESANVFWKTNSKLAVGVRQAGFLVGTKVPCILASRADSVDVKLNSIASAVMSVK